MTETSGRPPALLGRDRIAALASLVAVAGLAWVYLWLMAGHMAMDMGDDPVNALGAWSAQSLALNFLMWSVMMVGMMLPSASPAILLFASMARKQRERGSLFPPVSIFTSGYLAVWIAFSVLATTLQAGLQSSSLLTYMLVSNSANFTGGLFIAAGFYQLLPVKEVCLEKCRNPLQFFMFRWHGGSFGALRMGAEHGAYCVGCCWAIMLLLFTAGVMNLVWVAVLAAFVFVEKVLPAGKMFSRVSGLLLIGAGVYAFIM